MATFHSCSQVEGEPSSRGVPSLLLTLVLVATIIGGCAVDESEFAVESVEVTAAAASRRVILPDLSLQERRNLVDGFATDVEWGDAPQQTIAMNAEQGNGGGSFTAVMRAVHDSTRVYFLLQWPDTTPDNRGPRLAFRPDSAITQNCDNQIVSCHWELIPDDEDRVVFMFDADGVAGRALGTFDPGFDIAFGDIPGFQRTQLQGRVDIWQWRAARTNPLQFPIIGSIRLGFADDEYADASGRFPDAGTPEFFRENFRLVDCGDGSEGPVPLEFPLALDSDGQPSTAVNDFMRPCDYIYDPAGRIVTQCATANPCRLFEQADVTVWVEGDDVAAYLLRRPANTAARRSRHDVEARGRWEFGAWTLELSRLLNTGNGDDVAFDFRSAEAYSFKLAIMNNSGVVFSGSPQIKLRFGS